MLRTIAISLVLLLSAGIMLPFANSAHGIRQSANVTQKKSKRYRSRAWWRRYRARVRARRAAEELARRSTMMAVPQNIAMSVPQNISARDLSPVAGLTSPPSHSLPAQSSSMSFNDLPPAVMSAPITIETPDMTVAQTTAPSVRATKAPVAPAVSAPPAISAPAIVSAHAAAAATRPRVVNAVRPVLAPEATKLPGQMNLSVVALSRPNPIFLTQREQKKMLAGVPVADLKRIVIDKMVANGGWVVNDFVRDVNGSRVFVVTARTPKDALTPEKAWTFYFTEAGGRVYGLTTEAPVEYADRMTTEAERFIKSLRAKSEGTKE